MIATQQDARVEFIETQDHYGRTDYKGKYSLPLSEDEKIQYENTDEKLISARSTLARNSIEIYSVNSFLKEGKDSYELAGDFKGRSLKRPIEIEEGDNIFRILMYNKNDKISNQKLEKRLNKLLRNYKVNEDILKVPINQKLRLNPEEDSDRISLKNLEEDKNGDIELEEDNYSGGGRLEPFVLFKTEPISMPDDLFGIIRDTNLEGHTYHLNSRAIDPGYEGRVVTEVHLPEGLQPEYPPNWDDEIYLQIEIYEKTL